jgi:hypothetical protein
MSLKTPINLITNPNLIYSHNMTILNLYNILQFMSVGGFSIKSNQYIVHIY